MTDDLESRNWQVSNLGLAMKGKETEEEMAVVMITGPLGSRGHGLEG